MICSVAVYGGEIRFCLAVVNLRYIFIDAAVAACEL